MASLHEDPLSLPSLAEKFATDFPIGVAIEPKVLHEQDSTIAHHFRRLTAENAMKWGALCPIEHQYQFEKADAIAEFARRHSMKMTGHTFVWHQMAPPWLFKQGSSPASQQYVAQQLRNHIFALTERYADVVDNWDVVNEAVSDTSQELWRDRAEHSEWFATFEGESYVALAFEYAAEAAERFCPDIKLYYNDYRIEDADKRSKVIAVVRQLRKAGVRIDGVGIQGHINVTWPDLAELGRAIDEFAAENLLVKISELDVSIYDGDDTARGKYQAEQTITPELEERVAHRYAEVFELFRTKAALLTSVTLWGLCDDQSWLNRWPIHRKNHPLLFDQVHQPKLALRRLLGV